MKQLFLLLCLSVALFSCEDDEVVSTPESSDDPALTEADRKATTLANAPITSFKNISSSFSFLLESATEATVSFEGDEGETGPKVSRFEFGTDDYYVNKHWTTFYNVIKGANTAVDSISVVADEQFSANTKNRQIGKALFARALAYHYAVQLFGDVPLYTDNSKSSNLRRSPKATVYQQVVDDLVRAESLLAPASEVKIKSEPSAGSAQALLARVYLTWATANRNITGDGSVTPDNAKLAKAVEYADKVISSGAYHLLTDYTDNWGRDNKSDDELVFVFSHPRGGGLTTQNHQAHCAFTYAFDIEEPTHIGPADVNLYNKWSKNDVRREFSYTTELYNPSKKKWFYFEPPYTLARFGKGIDRTYENSVNTGPFSNDMDRLEIRYAEVLLIKAEALIEQNKDLATAKDLINQIRRRAYKVGEYSDGTVQNPADLEAEIRLDATGQSELRDALRQERFREFVYEQKRWTDLVRWGILIQTVKTVASFEHFKDDYKDGTPGVNSFFRRIHYHLHAKYNNVANKHYLFPIPSSVIKTNSNLEQNPGW